MAAPSTDATSVAYAITFPPLIDCHVHFRQPGLEHKGDMVSEGEAAYYGGVSAVCDMPNTKPPTNSIDTFADKVRQADEAAARATAAGQQPTIMYFFFGATEHAHLAQLRALWTQAEHAALKARCCGLKLYLDNSTGNLKSSAEVTEAAFALCGELGITLVAHCEQAEINRAAAATHPYALPNSHSQRRPPESEEASVQYAIGLAVRHSTALHIAHLSTAGGLAAIAAARAAHPTLRLTCEVTPHHLFMSSADYPCSCGGWLKVNPPVRDRQPHVEALWRGLLDGSIDCVSTDHAPHTIEEKQGSAAAGEGCAAPDAEPPSGLPGVELVVPLLLTVAHGDWPHRAANYKPTHGCEDGQDRAPAPIPAALHERKLTYDDIIRLMHTNPRRIFGLPLDGAVERKFLVNAPWQVTSEALHGKHKWSPYDGWKLVGKALLP